MIGICLSSFVAAASWSSCLYLNVLLLKGQNCSRVHIFGNNFSYQTAAFDARGENMEVVLLVELVRYR